jgi:hypothetical protein
VYDSAKQLRYGHLMIMTDQDHDGSHIKGLIMNFLHHFYPSLLKVNGFLLEFITPIVKVHALQNVLLQHRRLLIEVLLHHLNRSLYKVNGFLHDSIVPKILKQILYALPCYYLALLLRSLPATIGKEKLQLCSFWLLSSGHWPHIDQATGAKQKLGFF